MYVYNSSGLYEYLNKRVCFVICFVTYIFYFLSYSLFLSIILTFVQICFFPVYEIEKKQVP